MEAPQEAPPATERSLRPRRTMDQPCTGHGAPGKQALQAAHAYLSGEYDSPAASTSTEVTAAPTANEESSEGETDAEDSGDEM